MKYSILLCAVTVSTIATGHLWAVEIIKCPEKAPDGFIVLKSNQDECVQLKIAVAKQSGSISNMISHLGGETFHVIPMELMNNKQLKDIANLMEQAFLQSDEVIRTKITIMSETKGKRLVQIIKDANYLDLTRVLDAGIDVFSKKVFDVGLLELRTLDSRNYTAYKQDILENLPPELSIVVLQRNWYLFPPTVVTTLTDKSEVEAVAFSHDGKYILTGFADGTAKLWDARVRGPSRIALATLTHKANVVAVAFSPNDQHILTASEDRTAKLWDANARGDAKPLAIFRHDRPLYSIAFSSDGNTFVTGSWDGKARLWDANAKGDNNRPLLTLEHGGDGDSLLVSFGPDGKFILTLGSLPKKVVLKRWDATARGNNANPIETSERNARSTEKELAFSPDGKSFLTSGGAGKSTRLGAAIVNGNDAQPIAILSDKGVVLAGTYSPDGKYVVTSSNDGTVKLWDASLNGNDGQPLTTWNHGGQVSAVAFNANGKLLLTGGKNSNAKLWDIRYAANHLSLPAAQIVLYARKNNLAADKLPKHLFNELDDIAKTYLPKK